MKAEHGHQRFIDRPHLLGWQEPDTASEPLRISRAALFREHSRKRRINLRPHADAIALLLMPDALEKP